MTEAAASPAETTSRMPWRGAAASTSEERRRALQSYGDEGGGAGKHGDGDVGVGADEHDGDDGDDDAWVRSSHVGCT
jgi:hypothetical protein